MTANWITMGSDTTVLKGDCGRRFMPFTLAAVAVALSGCGAIKEEFDAENAANRAAMVAEATYHHAPSVNLCYAVSAYERGGNLSQDYDMTEVPCTDAVLAQVIKDAS